MDLVAANDEGGMVPVIGLSIDDVIGSSSAFLHL